MLSPNPRRDRPLIYSKGFSGLLLRAEVADELFKNRHECASYGNTHNCKQGYTRLQAYGGTRNTQRMEFKERLKQARKHARLTQTELGAAVGIDQTSISDLERGKSQSTSFIAEIAKACGVDALWLATGKGAMTQSNGASGGGSGHENVGLLHQPHRKAKEYPLISWVAAGCWQESCDNFQPGDADEWLLSEVNAGPHGYWLQVKGPSMLPTFTEGMRILVKPEGFDLVSGKFYIARLLDTGETTFKQYIRDSGLGFLQPLNQVFPTLPVTDNVQIIGQVVDGKLPPIF